ncbi:helicase [Streptomyces abyssalis]|uniref:Helicase n=1 Tax=Streptomyces abyssalis TaxID=933944 RepID=A0A1E7JJC1_9ACTN|nr:UvrD-helicase domain-containing protein [Streptomyces abyssalis]OEU87185.1 helicase [Streptomyces abyssalis]OEU87719.1 helicase [Streptomyces abyssalis]
MAAQHDSAREREIREEQQHLDEVYRRLEEKIHEAEFLMDDASKRAQVGTPGALAERDAQVFRAGVHLNRLNREFEDFLFGRIDLLPGADAERGPDGAYTSIEPAEGAVRPDGSADIAETLHVGRMGVLDADYTPLVIDWRAPAAAPFYRATPVAPGRVVRRRVIRSKGRQVLGVEDDLLRPEVSAGIGGRELSVVGDGALMAVLGRARGHAMRDIVSSIQAEQDMVIRAPAASVTEVEGGPGTGKTAVALHRAAYLLYQDRRRYAGGILVVSPTPLLVSYTEGVLPSLGEEGQVAVRALGSLVEGAEAETYDTPGVARVKGSARMAKVLHRAARAALDAGEVPDVLRVVAFRNRVELDAAELRHVRRQVLGGTAPVNLMRPRARKFLLDALWEKSGAGGRYTDPELAAEAREAFDEDISSEDEFIAFLDAWWPELTPRGVLASLADGENLARIAGVPVRSARSGPGRSGGGRSGARGSRSRGHRLLEPGEASAVAASLRRLDAHGHGPLSVHDVALLDELRVLLGPPPKPLRRETEPSPEEVLQQLTGLDELTTAADRDPTARRDRAERQTEERTDYAHVIVDEAQDLTPMQWRMVGRRGRHATWTVVGDPAQSSWPDTREAAEARTEALGARPRRRFELTVNYRNPAEIAELADRVLALAMPGMAPPKAVRSTGLRPRFAAVRGELSAAVREEAERALAEVDGTVGVIVPMHRRDEAREWLAGLGDRVVTLGSLEAKGLEYDATLVVSPAGIAGTARAEYDPDEANDENDADEAGGGGRAGAGTGAGLRVLYVALTRATQRLTVLSGEQDLPDADGVPELLRD